MSSSLFSGPLRGEIFGKHRSLCFEMRPGWRHYVRFTLRTFQWDVTFQPTLWVIRKTYTQDIKSVITILLSYYSNIRDGWRRRYIFDYDASKYWISHKTVWNLFWSIRLCLISWNFLHKYFNVEEEIYCFNRGFQ